MKWNSIAELVAAAQSAPIWKVILEDDLDEITPEHTEEAIRRMQLLWDTMKKPWPNTNQTSIPSADCPAVTVRGMRRWPTPESCSVTII